MLHLPTILDALNPDDTNSLLWKMKDIIWWRRACTLHLNENVTGATDKIGDSDMKSVLSK